MRIGAKNSTTATDRKHFLVRFDVGKAFISSVCVAFVRCRVAQRGVPDVPRCAKSPLKQGSTCTDESALTECFTRLRAVSLLSALCARLQMRAFVEACNEVGVSHGAGANEHILVSAGDTARQHERRDGHSKLSGKYSHQSFVSFAVYRRCRDANLKTTRANAFRRGAWTNTQMKQKIGALCGAPGLGRQGTGTK
jgi:hypothetical protein